MSLEDAFAQQAEACTTMGSPFMGQLLGLFAKNWPLDSAVADKLAGFEGDIGPAGHSLPLRLAGGLHALVLSGRDAALKELYPPHKAKDAALLAAVKTAFQTHADFLCDWVESPPQTNEIRRSAVLIAGAQVAATFSTLPICLSELGASGGLNLMWDHYALDLGVRRIGATMPAVILHPEWKGAAPPDASPEVVSRAGVDLNPLNPANGDDLLRMLAYLWADQPDRLTMTRAAASVMTAPIEKGDAIDWLAERLATAPEGQLHLIQNTVAWQYFPADAQARGIALIEAAGATATQNRPLAWLTMESDGDVRATKGAAMRLRLWPGNIDLDLGRADFHGRWIDWQLT